MDVMDGELFEQITKYFSLTNNKEGNEKRAKIYGFTEPGVQVAPGANIRIKGNQIGKNSFVGLYCYLNGDVKVGENCLIGPQCTLAAGNHKYDPETDWFSARTEGDGDDSIVVGDGTWIASGCTITGGVKIGRCNLICAGSVLTKSTEDYSIMAGVPAKKIGRIDPESGKYIYDKK